MDTKRAKVDPKNTKNTNQVSQVSRIKTEKKKVDTSVDRKGQVPKSQQSLRVSSQLKKVTIIKNGSQLNTGKPKQLHTTPTLKIDSQRIKAVPKVNLMKQTHAYE